MSLNAAYLTLTGKFRDSFILSKNSHGDFFDDYGVIIKETMTQDTVLSNSYEIGFLF